MTPNEKIKLADDMIKESTEYTIRNYLDTVQEIEAVEASPGPYYPPSDYHKAVKWMQIINEVHKYKKQVLFNS